jgi:hypothetical protein
MKNIILKLRTLFSTKAKQHKSKSPTVQWTDESPLGAMEMDRGYLKRRGVGNLVLERELLKIAQDEYVLREIGMSVSVFCNHNPDKLTRIDNSDFVYTLGEAQEDEFDSSIAVVPYVLYSIPKTESAIHNL